MMKELALQTIQKSPNNATIEEIIDAILIEIAIKKGLEDIEKGKVISHEDLLKEIETW